MRYISQTSNILLMTHATNTMRNLITDRIRAFGMKKADIALRAGISREMLYKFESGRADLSLSNALNLLSAVGLRVRVEPEFLPLPKSFREDKTRGQEIYLEQRRPESVVGVALGATIGTVLVPPLEDDLV